MVEIYDLYGLNFDGLEFAKERLESILNIEMNGHESSYHCGEYYRYKGHDSEYLILQKNYDDFDDEWTEERFCQFPLLLYVNQTSRSKELCSILESFERIKLLEHEEI